MIMKDFSKKLAKKPLALSPLSLAIAACGGGGGDSSSSNQSNSSTSTSYGSSLHSITSREMESNNTPKTSNFLKQTTFSGQSYSSTDDDYFQLNIPSWDVIKLTFSSNHWDDHEVSIIDSLGFTLSSKSISNNGTLVAKPYHDGEVYILVEGSDYDTANYTISLSQGSGNYEMEPNNFPDDADQIYNNTPIKGQSSSRTDDDYFVFTATSGTTTVSFSSGHWDDHQVTILNSAQQTMSQSSISNTGSVTSSTFIGQEYYVLVSGSDYDQEEYTLTLNPSNNPPIGNLSINGDKSEGQTLTVDTSLLVDLDGLGAFAYQWLRDGVDIYLENSQNYQLTALDIGSKISVRISYIDGAGKNEIINSQETIAISSAKTAQYYHNLFFDDFDDVRWENNIDQAAYTFGFATPENKYLWTDFELQNVREFTNSEKDIVIKAMSDWGEALPEVHFTQSDDGSRPDLFFCIGSTPYGTDGYWNSTWSLPDRIVIRSLIRFDESNPNINFRKTALHEIGNILGLGDIKPNPNIDSIMEDPFQYTYSSNGLTDFDVSMINTIYNYDGNLEIIT
ncbi:hypothetical protein N9301_04175 [Paracoccaceae bacterium]|nr:hypothetical protein [Paracoccaceae bacterium]